MFIPATMKVSLALLARIQELPVPNSGTAFTAYKIFVVPFSTPLLSSSSV
jgi:hypothetical protein